MGEEFAKKGRFEEKEYVKVLEENRALKEENEANKQRILQLEQ